jgi:hypothetical protein
LRLIVHMGLHKTGSTFLQHIMNDNHEALLANRIYYEKQPGYPGHHFAAWDILRGDTSPISTMIEDGRRSGCETVILSSEDLEGLIFDRNASGAVEEAASAAGVERIEWHMCLRDPGEYFSSLYAQLPHHVFADAASMLYEALREGMIMILDPLRGEPGTPYWCFCFDQLRYITSFAESTSHPVIAHDFRDAAPYPGWGILEAAGGLAAVHELPAEEARNRRMSDVAVREGYCSQILRLLNTEEQRRKILPLIDEHARQNAAAVNCYGEVIGEHFRESMAGALETFGYRRDGRGDQPLMPAPAG